MSGRRSVRIKSIISIRTALALVTLFATLSPLAHATHPLVLAKNQDGRGIDLRGGGAEETRVRQYLIDHALGAFEELLTKIEGDDLYVSIETDAKEQIDRYNRREDPAAPKVDFDRLNELRWELTKRFRGEFHKASFALALKYPGAVEFVLRDQDGDLPYVIFRGDSLVHQLLDLDTLAHLAQPHIPGHRIQHQTYITTARKVLSELRRSETKDLECQKVLLSTAVAGPAESDRLGPTQSHRSNIQSSPASLSSPRVP